MSLPPGFLDELRNRLSIAQVVGRKVTWDQRKSNPAHGDMWAPCPFHQEKTPSFHVNDKEGYYYCFGCHAKGDAISFVRETENVNFMEAVEILAREAGMTMPARDPKAQEKADRRSELAEVMEMAVRHFRLQLRSGAGAAARDYLAGRGLGEAAQDRWEIGFAQDAWQGLWDHLKEKGVADDLILDAGLAKPSQKGGKPYDTFRGRIMFPIRDARGRCIAFGGRAMDPNDQAKYLNSPETELFDKGRSLYNHGPAREASGKGQPLVVAEGYMDVIALSEAGFRASVAPLGTAVTEHQLAMLWRISDEPIIALDGDEAGLRAALRVVDLALPLLEAGKSLRFAIMPQGLDPDDLIRSEGPDAVRKVLEQAMPMVHLLWQRETAERNFDSPERKAALDKALREKIRLIRDPSIRKHYGEAIRELRWQLFRKAQPKRDTRQRRGWREPPMAHPSTRASVLAAGPDQVAEHLREAVILAAVLRCPEIAAEFESGIEMLQCQRADLAAIREAVLRHLDQGAAIPERVMETIGADALDSFFSQAHLTITPCLRHPGDAEMARMTVTEELAKLAAARGLAAEVAEAQEELAVSDAETLTWRLREAADAVQQAQAAGHEDRTEYDLAANGAQISRDERKSLDTLLESIRFSKTGR